MEEKKSSLAIWEDTLHKFNCAKITNRFKTADDFIKYLLFILDKTKEESLK